MDQVKDIHKVNTKSSQHILRKSTLPDIFSDWYISIFRSLVIRATLSNYSSKVQMEKMDLICNDQIVNVKL